MFMKNVNLDNLKEDKPLFNIDLQLFAEDPEDETDIDGMEEFDDDEEYDDEDSETEGDDPGLADDSDEDHSEEDEEDSDEDDEGEEEEPQEEKPQKDKVTKALIEQKKANKKLKQKLAEIEAENQRIVRKKKEELEVETLIEKGYGEEHAKKIVEQETELQMIRREMNLMRLERLEGKCPGIMDHADEIMNLTEKTGLKPEEIYNAKYRKISEYDIKTKAEQETLYRQKQAKKKKRVDGSSKAKEKPTKLSREDEQAYQILKNSKQFSGMTRKQFLELNKMDELE